MFATPVVGDILKFVTQGITGLANDAAQWSVRDKSIYKAFREAGYPGVNKASDIFELDLENVDQVVGWLGAKYKGITGTHGAVAGFLGLPAIAPDIAALILLNLRAIGEYAAYYGFDISSQEERLFALHVLGVASSPTDASKALAMTELVLIAKGVAANHTWKELEKHAFVKVVQKIANRIGVHLTKAKLAQVIPVSGAIIGSGFNLYFTDKVCNAAYLLYRERFLAEKYGATLIYADSSHNKNNP